jgi:glyoxylase-like metal-dependent hydrolase (beta-lactamase superfamily II)
MTEVAPGIHWIKLPITTNEQIAPPNINVYIIKGTSGYLLVDSGWNTDESFATLHNALIKNGTGFQDIAQIVVTHIHPDHYGMAGRIKKISGASIAMHHIEKDLIKPRYIDMEELLHQSASMLAANGVPKSEMVGMRDATLPLVNYVVPIPPDIALHDGETIATGLFTFRVIWTPGHSSGHICLYEPDKKILLCGDHILPKITPNIGVHPQSIENPLGRYLKSLQEIRQLDIELTLPGHDQPFTDIRSRIDEIIHHHNHRNLEILEAISFSPKTAYQIAKEITWGDNSRWQNLPIFHQRMAIFETLAHLEMMAADSRLDKLSKKGIIYYRQR